MSESRKVAIGVAGGILGIAAMFTLILLLVGKGEQPTTPPQSLLADPAKPVALKA
jgi:hypothetical protein